MKKLNLLICISIGLIILSCSPNNDCGDSNNTQNLILITKEYYTNNSLTSSTKFNFYSNKLINIQYSDNSYDDIYYEGGLISRILEFKTNNEWEWTTTYTYTSSNELIQKKVIPSPNNTITDVSRQKDFVYGGNLIQSENSWSDGGFHKNTISLNSKNFMTEDKLFNNNDVLESRYLFEYINNNLSKKTLKNHEDNIVIQSTYNYLNQVETEPYKYNKYLYGSEWKNNSSLNKQFGLGQVNSYEISENYISNYYTYNFELSISITGTFNYEFDSNERIIQQTENINWSTGEKHKIITKYHYE